MLEDDDDILVRLDSKIRANVLNVKGNSEVLKSFKIAREQTSEWDEYKFNNYLLDFYEFDQDEHDFHVGTQEDFEKYFKGESDKQSWLHHSHSSDRIYFAIVNKTRDFINQGDQIYYCYGSRPNRNLMLVYGFTETDNPYDTFYLLIKTDSSVASEVQSKEVDFPMDPDDDRFRFELKPNQFCFHLLKFIRVIKFEA